MWGVRKGGLGERQMGVVADEMVVVGDEGMLVGRTTHNMYTSQECAYRWRHLALIITFHLIQPSKDIPHKGRPRLLLLGGQCANPLKAVCGL